VNFASECYSMLKPAECLPPGSRRSVSEEVMYLLNLRRFETCSQSDSCRGARTVSAGADAGGGGRQACRLLAWPCPQVSQIRVLPPRTQGAR